jgi:hypothetical protein
MGPDPETSLPGVGRPNTAGPDHRDHSCPDAQPTRDACWRRRAGCRAAYRPTRPATPRSRRMNVIRILAKLQLRDRVQAVVLAYETGLAGSGSQSRLRVTRPPGRITGGWPSGWRSQVPIARRVRSRPARAAAASAASLSVRVTCRAGSSCMAQPVRAAVSRAMSSRLRIPVVAGFQLPVAGSGGRPEAGSCLTFTA